MTISDINILARLLTKTTTVSLTAANLLILVNKYYEQITGRLLTETGAGQMPYGDFNYSAFPSFTINMVAGTQSYDLNDWGTSDEEAILNVLGVEVKTSSGTWLPLKRITLEDINNLGIGQSDYQSTNGLPTEYEIRDNFIILYPAPASASTTLTAGLKVHHLRTADKFTSGEVTTGTKEPGFPSPWHDLLAYGPAYDVCLANGLPMANNYRIEFDRRMKEMLAFIGRRDQATRSIMRPRKTNYI